MVQGGAPPPLAEMKIEATPRGEGGSPRPLARKARWPGSEPRTGRATRRMSSGRWGAPQSASWTGSSWAWRPRAWGLKESRSPVSTTTGWCSATWGLRSASSQRRTPPAPAFEGQSSKRPRRQRPRLPCGGQPTPA